MWTTIRQGGAPMLFELDLATAIFLFCLVMGGGLRLVAVLLDDVSVACSTRSTSDSTSVA